MHLAFTGYGLEGMAFLGIYGASQVGGCDLLFPFSTILLSKFRVIQREIIRIIDATYQSVI